MTKEQIILIAAHVTKAVLEYGIEENAMWVKQPDGNETLGDEAQSLFDELFKVIETELLKHIEQ